jgi:hypothetical protein
MVQRDRSSLYKWSGENECSNYSRALKVRSAMPHTPGQSAELTATRGLLIPAILPKRRSSHVWYESI